MEHQHIEPLILVLTWSQEFDVPFPKCAVQTFIPAASQPIERQFSVSLLEKKGREFNLLNIIDLSKVVDEVRHLENVHGTQGPFLNVEEEKFAFGGRKDRGRERSGNETSHIR